ncbi:MAG: site-specific integrase, partial [Gammaproteobacteria bacterium]|nr:site-specific integrase [Gammaproteobacteria bacterium]
MRTDALSLDQARKQADKLRGQVALGQDPAEAKAVLKQVPTLAAFVKDRYLPFVQGYKRAWKTDESLLRNHILPVMGDRHLDEITKEEIVALHHGRVAAGAAPGSANRLLILLRYIFNLAIKWEIAGVTKNPTKGLALLEENNKLERYLSQEEAQRLYAAVVESSSEMLAFIIPLLILTGARKREVLDAKWIDFDVDKRLWRIPKPKSGKARHVPLSDGVVQLLAQLEVHQADWPEAIKAGGWLVPNPQTGVPFRTIFYSWDSARKK